jgi:ferredoxin-NADP reductase
VADMNSPSSALERRAPAQWQRFIAPLITPEIFDFWASRLHPTLSWQRALARVIERKQESADAVTLRLKPNRHWTGFRAGQHVNLTVEVRGMRVTRSYSLSDAPRADRSIAITVKAIEGGRVSQHLFHAAKVGDVFDIGPAFGEMAIPTATGAPIALLAAGSGITPLMAMIRALAADGMPAPVTLLYWARTRDEFCYAHELRQMAQQYPAFRVVFFLTRASAASADEREGRIDETAVSVLADVERQHIFACGPGAFTQTAHALLAARSQAFAAEAFTPPPQIVDESGDVEITLTRSQRTLTVPRGQSILSALEAQGVRPPHGCRMGLCNTCACGKPAGTTKNLHSGSVNAEPALSLRICINGATSNLTLDL